MIGQRRTPPAATTTVMEHRNRSFAMVASLKALLDPVPNARRVFPHLAALEHDLGLHGLAILERAPLNALVRASQELASLPIRPDDTALQDLGCLLLGELDGRGQNRPRSAGFLSTFVSDEKLQVSEASHTDFMRIVDNNNGGTKPR